MTTAEDARNWGFITPVGTDAISNGDDAITANAIAATKMRYPQGAAGNTDVFTLPGGVHSVVNENAAATLANLPEILGGVILVITNEHFGVSGYKAIHFYPRGRDYYYVAVSATTTTMGEWAQLPLAGNTLFVRQNGDQTNGMNLDDMRTAEFFGWWGVYKWSGGPTNLPADFTGRGFLEVGATTTTAVVQTITARDTNEQWRRTCKDPVRSVWTDWRQTAGAVESDRTNIGMIGDSLVASHNLVQSMAAALPGRYVYSRGWNGNTSDDLCLRMGASDVFWTVAGGTIPTSGSVAISTEQALALTSADTYYTGHLAGVAGRISKTSSGFEFVRDEYGLSVSVPNPVKMEPNWTKNIRSHIVGILLGRNDVSDRAVGVDGTVAQHIAANFTRLVNMLTPDKPLYFLMGTINRTTEPRDSEGYNIVVEANRLIREKYPDRFIDVRGYLVNQAIHDLGITPTEEDLTNIDNDCPPPSVMTDITHYTDAAATAIADNLIVPWLIGRGYVATV